MRKFTLILFLLFTLITPYQRAHALNAKGKAFLVICTYGTVGGALLGFASMAFGTNSRAIAQGASLGLYAGIAFGSYVVTSHRKPGDELMDDPNYQQQPPPGFGTPPPGGGAFDQGGSGQGGFGAPPPAEEDSGGFFGSPQRYIQINEDLMYNYKLKKRRGFSAPIYLPLLNVQF